jgi:hypothetical protein
VLRKVRRPVCVHGLLLYAGLPQDQAVNFLITCNLRGENHTTNTCPHEADTSRRVWTACHKSAAVPQSGASLFVSCVDHVY